MLREYKKNEYCKVSACEELLARINNKKHRCKECEAYKLHDYIQKNNGIILMSDKECSNET